MIRILDQLVSRPGQGQALHDRYLADYVPLARARGLTLDTILAAPPVWLDDQPNRLFFLWSLPDSAAVWRKNEARRDPAVLAVWARIDALCERRRRDTLADPADFDALADV